MSQVRRGSENQYSVSMWGVVILALAMAWVILGRGILSDVLQSEPMGWAIYCLVIALGGLAVHRAHRAEKASRLLHAAGKAARPN
tara:strand:+ start:12390 stop:12644 length:255 start_codon:yes stop_codon:yes gene_type:complete